MPRTKRTCKINKQYINTIQIQATRQITANKLISRQTFDPRIQLFMAMIHWEASHPQSVTQSKKYLTYSIFFNCCLTQRKFQTTAKWLDIKFNNQEKEPRSVDHSARKADMGLAKLHLDMDKTKPEYVLERTHQQKTQAPIMQKRKRAA